MESPQPQHVVLLVRDIALCSFCASCHNKEMATSRGVSSFKFQVLRRARQWSGFKLYTLHFKLGRRPFVRNKPNASLADCGQICGGTPAPRPAVFGLPRPIVQNKANFGEPGWDRRAKCAKHSRSARVSGSRCPTLNQVDGRLYQEPIVPNKAKLGQDGTSGGRRAREGPMVRNKPNLRRGVLSGKCWKERKICGIAQQEGGGKTKPISAIVPIGIGLPNAELCVW